MCKLASKINNLEVFVHVSTTYCNHNLKKSCYEEKLYEPCQDWRVILKLIETENPAVMNTISYKIIEDHPNTYTFSKSLSEKIVEEYSSKFPAVIARPSVVFGIYSDPVPGWTDNVYGLLGISTAVTKGVMRVMKGRSDCCLDYIPVDVAINALIISSWEKANSENNELSIYNCAYADSVAVTFKELGMTALSDGMNDGSTIFDNDIWYPFLLLTTNDFYFHFLFYTLQVIPAVLIDSILYLMKKERRLMKLTITIYQAIQALSPFTMKEIKFNNRKYHALWEKLSADEAEVFLTRPPSDFNKTDIILLGHRGLKKYFLKENLADNELHMKKLRRLYYLHQFTKGILIILVFTSLYKLMNLAINIYI
ncbi:unnamed protein product [Nezara viridula]|uniref:Fatty acyl-CoA reductase n=1 Tax=Nezara viridula TaxID=85310 RepID=A0A9P0MLK8_NEZVI|nr:unnamed protein product [Nezara viridula]